MAEEKYVYFFGNGKAEGNGEMKQLLGGKGAGLAEMTRAKLPVPAGFTITTEVCQLYYSNNKKYPAGLERSVKENLQKLEKSAGKKLGDPNDPLLVSVRSGAPVSMPGMMETILNLGLTDKSVEGLAKKTSNRRFALDAYRRFIMMYGSTAMGIDRIKFDDLFDEVKEKHTRGRLNIAAGKKVGDTDVNEDELAEVITKFKALYKKEIKKDFPQDPIEQLWGAIGAVFNSWMAEKAVTYRRVENLVGIKGTAVNVMQMVFGNKGDTSGTGVCFTRDPNSGENIFYGDYLFNAQGEDVVAVGAHQDLEDLLQPLPGLRLLPHALQEPQVLTQRDQAARGHCQGHASRDPPRCRPHGSSVSWCWWPWLRGGARCAGCPARLVGSRGIVSSLTLGAVDSSMSPTSHGGRAWTTSTTTTVTLS